MTTIAYDGKYLAADTQITAGGMVVGEQSKITKLTDGRYVAIAGALALAPAVIAWLNGGTDAPEPKSDENVSGIVVDPKAPLHPLEFESSLRLFPATLPYTGGSGAAIALTALHCGLSVPEAVELACKLDTASGGAVEVVKL